MTISSRKFRYVSQKAEDPAADKRLSGRERPRDTQRERRIASLQNWICHTSQILILYLAVGNADVLTLALVSVANDGGDDNDYDSGDDDDILSRRDLFWSKLRLPCESSTKIYENKIFKALNTGLIKKLFQFFLIND